MFTIRQAARGDAGEVLTVQRAAFVAEARAHHETELPPLMEPLESVEAAIGAGEVLVAHEGSRLVGAVRRQVRDREVHIGRLVVAPDRQGRGIGSALLAAAEDCPDALALVLFTGEFSLGNLALYQRRGYRETGRTPVLGYHLVHLRKEL